MSHPVHRPGTPEHLTWVLERVSRWLETDSHQRTRRAFEVYERDRYPLDVGRVTKRDLAACGGWNEVHSAARSSRGVDVSGLDWDDDEESTSPDRVPLGAIPDGHYVRGVSTLVGPDGATRGQWIKTGKESESREQLLERLLSSLPERVPVKSHAEPSPSVATDEDLLAVYPMGDPHVGMLAWAPEAGEDFDLDIATSIMRGAIDELTRHEPRAASALVCNVGDYFHSDDPSNRTRRGNHQLDVDGRWYKVLRVGIDLMVYTIDAALRAHDRVTVINAIGNHDDTSSLMLSVALDHHYSNEPRVEVLCSPAAHTYRRFGSCLLGVTHGDTTKLSELGQVMSVDRAEDWGQTRWRYWYTGHVHHKRVQEYPGVVCESFRTLATKDAWHAREGYRSGRDMNRILLHRKWGEIARSTVSAAYLQARMEAS